MHCWNLTSRPLSDQSLSLSLRCRTRLASGAASSGRSAWFSRHTALRILSVFIRHPLSAASSSTRCRVSQGYRDRCQALTQGAVSSGWAVRSTSSSLSRGKTETKTGWSLHPFSSSGLNDQNRKKPWNNLNYILLFNKSQPTLTWSQASGPILPVLVEQDSP